MLYGRSACATAVVLAATFGAAPTAGFDPAREATQIRHPDAAELRLAALSDWPGPRAQEYLPEAARGETRRLGDEVRGGDGCRGPVDLAVLTPPYTGVTIEAQPTLFWFVGADTGAPVEVELYGAQVLDPILKVSYAGGLPTGIHALALADHEVDLERDVEYEWSVAVLCDPEDPAGDIVSAGTIRHVAPPPDLRRQLDDVSLERRAQLLIEYGIWYDVLEALATLIERSPKGEQWLADRARLLKQVGLPEAAAYEP